jgi:cysteine desulfuration protein SufE
MTLHAKLAQLIEDFSLIENSLERFSAIVEHYRKLAPLPPAEQTDDLLVRGCVSRVWVSASFAGGLCYFQSEADSPILQGVVRLVTDFYSGATPQEIIAVEPEFLDSLRIADQLTPTRRNGLRHVRTRIVEFARTHLPPAA